MDKKSRTKDTYNASARAMSDKFNAIGPRVKDIVRTFSYMQKNNPAVLEIGCGNGRDAKEILKYTQNYIGLDYSSKLLAIAQANLPEAKFELADIEECTISAGLDVIFSFASLLHTDKENLTKIFAKAYTALNVGGVFFLSLKQAIYKEEAITDAWGTRVFYFYTPELIQSLAGKNFKNVYTHLTDAKDGIKWFEIILQK